MARSTVAGQPAIPRAGCFDQTVAKELQDTMCQGAFVTYSGTADVLAFPGDAQFTNSSGDAATLVAPIAGGQPAGDDGKELFVVDNVGAAHTITTPANGVINSKHVLTFNGTLGSNCRLKAMGGVWVPNALLGVSVTS